LTFQVSANADERLVAGFTDRGTHRLKGVPDSWQLTCAGSGIRFEDRGMHALKGVPEEWHVFAVQPA
jgi:hypothetical protein